LTSLTLPRAPHPASRFVTLRNAPRSEQDGSIAKFDLPDGESQIFLPTGLDRNFDEASDLRVRQSLLQLDD